MREYNTLAALRHPRIVEVYEYGVGDGTPYDTMELLDGEDLKELSPLPYREACSYPARHRVVAGAAARIELQARARVADARIRSGADG